MFHGKNLGFDEPLSGAVIKMLLKELQTNSAIWSYLTEVIIFILCILVYNVFICTIDLQLILLLFFVCLQKTKLGKVIDILRATDIPLPMEESDDDEDKTSGISIASEIQEKLVTDESQSGSSSSASAKLPPVEVSLPNGDRYALQYFLLMFFCVFLCSSLLLYIMAQCIIKVLCILIVNRWVKQSVQEAEVIAAAARAAAKPKLPPPVKGPKPARPQYHPDCCYDGKTKPPRHNERSFYYILTVWGVIKVGYTCMNLTQLRRRYRYAYGEIQEIDIFIIKR